MSSPCIYMCKLCMYVCVYAYPLVLQKSNAKTSSAVLLVISQPATLIYVALLAASSFILGEKNITVAQLWGEVALVRQHTYCFLTLYGLKEFSCIFSKVKPHYSVDMLMKEFTLIFDKCQKLVPKARRLLRKSFKKVNK